MNDLKMGNLIQKQQRYGRKGYGSVVVDLEAPVSDIYNTLADIRQYQEIISTVKAANIYQSTDTCIKAEFCLSRFYLKINVVHVLDAEKVSIVR